LSREKNAYPRPSLELGLLGFVVSDLRGLCSVFVRDKVTKGEREREREREWSALALLVRPGRTSAVLVGDAQVCWVLERGARSAGFQRERERWQRESVGQWVPVGGEGEIWEMGGNFGNECEMTATRVLNLLKKKEKKKCHVGK
jgi:hypothetical protein